VKSKVLDPAVTSVESFLVRVDTPGGQRKTYTFESLNEANAFVIGCADKIVSGPTCTVVETSSEM
jgi:hypothetical protein